MLARVSHQDESGGVVKFVI